MAGSRYLRPPIFVTHETPESGDLKFDLFMKVREIRSATETLQRVSTLEPAQQHNWVKENEEFVTQLLEVFMDDSVKMMDGVPFDEEAVQMSVELMSRLHESLALLNGLAGTKRAKGGRLS